MLTFGRVAVVLILWTSLLGAAGYEGVTLQFTPTEKVFQTHTFDWTLDIDIPGNPLKNRVQQTIECAVSIRGDQTASIEEAPFTIEVVIQRIAFDTDTNGVKMQYDTGEESIAPQVALLRQVIGRPMSLSIGADYTMPLEIPELHALHSRLPELSAVMPESMLREMFQYLIALAGRQLTVGLQSQQELRIGATLPVSMALNYEVVRANYKEVEAALSGNLASQRQSLAEAFKDKPWWGAKPGSLRLEGKVFGKGSWRRPNALLCQLKLEQEVRGEITMGDDPNASTAAVRGRSVHQIQSRRL